jgi:hypothetical protein
VIAAGRPWVAVGLVAFVAAMALQSAGCNWVKEKTGLGRIVKEPEEESVDWVVQQVLKSAAMEPFDAAFAEYSKYIHSTERGPQAMKDWETMRFRALRNKYSCFLRADEGHPYAFKVMETREEAEDYIKLFVSCKTTDMPTPCNLKKDTGAGGKWRIVYGCLN